MIGLKAGTVPVSVWTMLVNVCIPYTPVLGHMAWGLYLQAMWPYAACAQNKMDGFWGLQLGSVSAGYVAICSMCTKRNRWILESAAGVCICRLCGHMQHVHLYAIISDEQVCMTGS